MKIIFILLMSIKVAYLFEPLGLNSTYNSNTGLVFNGQKYNPEEYPYVVSIKIHSLNTVVFKSICTGTLIKPLYVLTSALCIWGQQPSQFEVYVGPFLDNTDFRLVSKIDIHERFNQITNTLTADISLLKLKRPFKNVKKYIQIGGNKKEFADLNPIQCVCIGFGAVDTKKKVNPEGAMMTTKVRHGKAACRNPNNNFVRRTWAEYLCATTPMTSMVCLGDIGGPLICHGKLYGIFSYYYNYSDPNIKGANSMMRCGGPNMQTVHVFLQFYSKWINKKINKKKKNSGNMLKVHLTLHTIIALLMYGVLTSILK